MNRLFKILTVGILAIITAFTCFGCAQTPSGDGETGLFYKKITDGYMITKYVSDGKTTSLNIGTELAEISSELGNGTKLVINKNAFKGCSDLETLIVPETVTEIKEGAFAGMIGLKELVVPFIGRTANSDVEYENSSAEDKSVGSARTIAHFFTGATKYTGGVEVAVNYNATAESSVPFIIPMALRTITIKNSSTEGFSVPMYAFNGLAKSITVNFDGKLTAIGEGAFANTNISSFTVPATVTKIYKNAFANTAKLETISFASATALTEIGEGAFQGSAIKEVVLPANLTKIGGGAFMNSKLEKITLSAGLTDIGNNAFYKCSELTSVYTDGIASASLTLGVYAFSDCVALEYFGVSTSEEANLIDLAVCKEIGSQAFDKLGEEEEEFKYANEPSGFTENDIKNIFGTTKVSKKA